MAGIIPREFIGLLVSKVELVDLIQAKIPLHKKSNENYFACCPFHNEKSASFSVSQPKQFYYCFGCGAHGNAIDFMMQYERLNFVEAIEALARVAGMEVPHQAGAIQKTPPLAALYAITKQAARYYYEQMRKSQRAICYLKARHIFGEVARDFQIGYAPSGFSVASDWLKQNGCDHDLLLQAGLIAQKNAAHFYDRFRDRIIFPIRDYQGRVVGFGGRVIDQGEPKYLNSPETPLFQKGHELYGLYEALKLNRQLSRFLIVEGYLDVIALFQHDITYVAATLGTATTEHHIKRLSRYTSDLIFCFDGDKAGRTAAGRALKTLFPLLDDNLQVRFLFLPEGEDPDSLIHREGKASFEARIEKSVSLSDFFFESLSKQSDMDSMEGRARFAKTALTQINQLHGNILRKMLKDELSKRSRVNLDELGLDFQTAPFPKKPPLLVLDPGLSGKIALPLKVIAAMLLEYPHFAHLVELFPENRLPGYSFIIRLITHIKNNPEVTTGALIEYCREQSNDVFPSIKIHWQPAFSEENATREFLGAIRQVNLLWLDEEINRLLAKSAQTQTGLTPAEKSQLFSWLDKKQHIKSSMS